MNNNIHKDYSSFYLPPIKSNFLMLFDVPLYWVNRGKHSRLLVTHFSDFQLPYYCIFIEIKCFSLFLFLLTQVVYLYSQNSDRWHWWQLIINSDFKVK